MANDGMIAEINEAITESLEAQEPIDGDFPEGGQEKPEAGGFDVNITGDIDLAEEGSGDDAANRERDSEDGKKDKEIESGEETGEPTDETEEDSGDAVDDRTVSEAVSHGMSVSEARSFRSDSQLSRTIEIIREQNRLSLLDGEKPDDDTQDIVPFSLPELDPEKYDKEIIETFGMLRDEVNRGRAEISELQESQGGTNAASQQAAEAELTRWIDKKFSDLGDGFHKTIGKGDTAALGRDSTELSARESIASHMSIMHDGYVSQGLDAPSIDELFDSSSKFILAEDFRSIDKGKLRGKLEKRSGQLINRVGRSGDSEKTTPQQETADILNERFGV